MNYIKAFFLILRLVNKEHCFSDPTLSSAGHLCANVFAEPGVRLGMDGSKKIKRELLLQSYSPAPPLEGPEVFSERQKRIVDRLSKIR